MTQEEKELLIKELCSRLRYCPYINICDGKEWYTTIMKGIELDDNNICGSVTTNFAVFAYKPEYVKPYLRPMSSMTEEEREHLQSLHNIISDENYEDGYSPAAWETISEFNDYCHEHHLDNRGLIGKGLALKAPKNMYKQ